MTAPIDSEEYAGELVDAAIERGMRLVLRTAQRSLADHEKSMIRAGVAAGVSGLMLEVASRGLALGRVPGAIPTVITGDGERLTVEETDTRGGDDGEGSAHRRPTLNPVRDSR